MDKLSSGFIFADGSILDIDGEDHTIIDKDYWIKYRMITYRRLGVEVNFRIFGGVTIKQVGVILAFMMVAPDVVVDLYDENGKYLGDMDIAECPQKEYLLMKCINDKIKEIKEFYKELK